MAPKLTRELLAERVKSHREASDLERRARSLRKRVEQIDAIASAELKASGKAAIRRAGYTLSWVDGRASVSWKDEFIRVAGPDEADRLAAEAKPGQRLQITAPAEAAVAAE